MRQSSAQFAFFSLAAALFFAGCVHHARPAPPLVESAADSRAPAQPGVLTRTADTTWSILTAPVRLVTPSKKPAPAAPPVYEAPEAIFITPTSENASPPATQP